MVNWMIMFRRFILIFFVVQAQGFVHLNQNQKRSVHGEKLLVNGEVVFKGRETNSSRLYSEKTNAAFYNDKILHSRGGSLSLGLKVKGNVYEVNALYMRWLHQYPCRTKSISAGVVTAIGDLIAQIIESSTSASLVFDWKRMWSFTIAATLYVGPFVHYIYELLWFFGRQLEKRGIKRTLRTIFQVLFDQTVGVWTFFPSYFYVHAIIDAVVRSRAPDFSLIHEKVKKELFGIIVSNYKLWPLVNYINFTYVPESLRVLVSNIVSILWNAYLCTRMTS